MLCERMLDVFAVTRSAPLQPARHCGTAQLLCGPGGVFHRAPERQDWAIISVHTHNDRALRRKPELALLAGAAVEAPVRQRERTGTAI